MRGKDSLPGDQSIKSRSRELLSIPHSTLTSIYAGSVPAAEMLGCQSLGDLERYFESVTTHLSLGQPRSQNQVAHQYQCIYWGLSMLQNTLSPHHLCKFSYTSRIPSQKVHFVSHQGVQWAARYVLSWGKIPAVLLNIACRIANKTASEPAKCHWRDLRTTLPCKGGFIVSSRATKQFCQTHGSIWVDPYA